MKYFDSIVAFFQYPIWMLLFGLVFWFTLLWSIARNKNKSIHFWYDQKDEILVSGIGGFIFLLFTNVVLDGWDYLLGNEEPTCFHEFYYLLVGPAIAKIYSFLTDKKNG